MRYMVPRKNLIFRFKLGEFPVLLGNEKEEKLVSVILGGWVARSLTSEATSQSGRPSLSFSST